VDNCLVGTIDDIGIITSLVIFLLTKNIFV